MARDDLLVWIDLEMTGLDPRRCVIVEIATLVTDATLEVVAEGPNLVIHADEAALSGMDDYVRAMHTRSGLLERIGSSATSVEAAEAETVAFLTEHVAPRSAPLCGNSIWKDRHFIEHHMPNLDAYLHYRCIDVSTLKELGRRWYPHLPGPPAKGETHRALDDIRESIIELRHYRTHLFHPSALPGGGG
ncbi:MAG: oligoribonuclease [Myxococcota bacterium]